MKNNRLIIIIMMLGLIVISSTFAWFTYRSKESALVLSIGDINDSKVIIKPYQIRETLTPVNTYTSGIYSQVTAINNNSNDLTLILFYKINELDEVLINNGLKYTITSSTSLEGTYTELTTSDFAYAVGSNQLEILNTTVTGKTTMYYRVYLWLDSSVGNQTIIQNSVLNIELNAKGETNGISFDDHTQMITSYTCNDENGNPVTVGDNPYFTYTGQCEVIDDGDGDWRIRFLTDGDFTSTLNIPIDVFLVGGGASGGYGDDYSAGFGGGGGYTTTKRNVNLTANTNYAIIIGEGAKYNRSTCNTDSNVGGTTSAFSYLAEGGKQQNGGSGGGGICVGTAAGGSNGSNGEQDTSLYEGGTGQELTTREFEEMTGDLYAGGGGCGGYWNGTLAGAAGGSGGGGIGQGHTGSTLLTAGDGETNTGGGGGGAYGGSGTGGNGGSGIVVIRNTRSIINNTINIPSFRYTGDYQLFDENDNLISLSDSYNGTNWKIKFLTTGFLTITEYRGTTRDIDIFLVGGGASGGIGQQYAGGPGGGGGYTTTVKKVILSTDIEYKITVGAGSKYKKFDVNSSNSTSNEGGTTSLVQGSSTLYSAKGGIQQNGGSGGGGFCVGTAIGGSNGSDGGQDSSLYPGGTGQGTTTREFGDTDGKLYAGGGGCGGYWNGTLAGASGGSGGGGKGQGHTGSTLLTAGDGEINTGGGGGGAYGNSGTAGSGGSGIVIIRNTR